MTTLDPAYPNDEALIAKLTNAIGRVDAGSVGGYTFRRHVAETDLLPLVKTLLSEQAEEIAQAIEVVRDSVGKFPIENLDDLLTSHQAWTNAAQIARDLGAGDAS